MVDFALRRYGSIRHINKVGHERALTRRSMVAQLRAAGVTHWRAIQQALPDYLAPGVPTPKSRSTIYDDIKAVTAEWVEANRCPTCGHPYQLVELVAPGPDVSIPHA